MERRREIFLLTCIAIALLVLATLVANVARLGSAIGREVQHAQMNYMHVMGDGGAAEQNAMLLGQCLRSEMLKQAQAGLVHPDIWALTARIKALPGCTQALPRIDPPATPVIYDRRPHAFMTSAPSDPTPARPVASLHVD